MTVSGLFWPRKAVDSRVVTQKPTTDPDAAEPDAAEPDAAEPDAADASDSRWRVTASSKKPQENMLVVLV